MLQLHKLTRYYHDPWKPYTCDKNANLSESNEQSNSEYFIPITSIHIK